MFGPLLQRLDHQLLALFALLFAIAIGAFGKYTGEEQYASSLRIVEQHALRWGAELASESAADLVADRRDALRSTLRQMLRNSDANRLAVFAADGTLRVAMGRGGNGQPVESLVVGGLRPPVAPIADVALLDHEVQGARTILTWAPMSRDGRLIGWAMAEFDTRGADEIREHIIEDSVIVGVTVIVSATLLVFLFLRAPMRSVRQAREFANQLDTRFGGQGDFSRAPTEIRKLGEALNRASRRLLDQHSALVEGERRKTVILDAALDAIVAIDANGIVTEFNPSAERLFGYTRSMVIGHPAAEFIAQSAEDDDVARAFGEFVQGGGRIERRELAGRHRDGRRFVAEVAFAAIDGEPARTYIAYLRDITDKKQSRDALEDQLEFVKQLLDAIPTPVYVKDAQGAYLSVNKAWCGFMGIDPGAATGRTVGQLFPPEVAAIHEHMDAELMATGVQSYMVRARRADGETRELLISKARFSRSDGSVAGLIGVLTDITEHKRAEQAMRAARDAAEGANRAKSDFLANMSHEIRTPMNAILGLTDVVLEGELAGEQREHLKMVKDAADSLLGIINEILDFSKIESGHLDFEVIPFSLRDAVGLAVRTLAQKAAEKGLELNFQVDRATGDAYRGDPHRLRQVLTNLIGNALKFTERGEVEISVRAEPGQDRVHFMVRDTGIGIPTDKQLRIFEAFEQADTSTTRRFGGTGLGLAICRRLVEAMHGEIWVESAPGAGSTFHFTARLESIEDPVAPARLTSELMEREVLVVEGHGTGRRILVDMLNGWGMRVRGASSGAQAQAMLAERQPELAIVGGGLADMESFDLVAALRGAAGPGLRMMVLMAAGMHGDAQRCRELGVAAYLIKPVAEAELLDAVRIALEMQGDDETPVTRHTLRERQRASLKLLLAEDNPVNQRLAVRLLEKLGHKVTVVGDGAEAVAAVAADAWDAVLMDVQMPVLGGFEATARIRAAEAGSARRVPIIAMTAHALEGDRERCLAAGMDAYVAKPIQLPMLVAALDAVVEGAEARGASAGDDPAAAPLLERAAMLRNLDGDEELLAQLLALLREELPAQRAQLAAAAAAGDAPRLRTVAHAIKGSVMNFGAVPLVRALQAIESVAAGGDAADARRALELLDRLAAEISD